MSFLSAITTDLNLKDVFLAIISVVFSLVVAPIIIHEYKFNKKKKQDRKDAREETEKSYLSKLNLAQSDFEKLYNRSRPKVLLPHVFEGDDSEEFIALFLHRKNDFLREVELFIDAQSGHLPDPIKEHLKIIESKATELIRLTAAWNVSLEEFELNGYPNEWRNLVFDIINELDGVREDFRAQINNREIC